MKPKSKNQQNKSFIEKVFRLSQRKELKIIIIWGLVFIIHNFIYSSFKFKDLISFTLATLIIPFYFVLAIVYSIIKYLIEKKNN